MEPKGLDHDDELGCKISKIKLTGDKLADLDDKSTPSALSSSSPTSVSASSNGGRDDAAEAKLDLEVEREWKQIQHDAGSGKIEIANNPRAKKIASGLVINHMNMRCGDTGKLLWQSEEWGDDVYTTEQEARIPAAILNCSAVSREINFSSVEEIPQFRLEQRVFLEGSCIEEWLFAFGYVIPGSTNTWQQTIEAAGADNMLDPSAISGKLTIETAFYDGQSPIAKTVYRIFYV